MLGLFGKKSDHPMADVKSALKMLEDLPKHDSLKALQELTGWVQSMRDDRDIRLDNRFAVLSLLDETARPFERKLVREFFSTTALTAFHESRLWTALDAFYAELGEAYHEVLTGCRDGEKGASALKSQQPLIVARGIQATVGRLKSAAVHYKPVEPALWQQLAEYYGQAEAQKFLDEQIEIYPGMGASISVRHQCAGVLLWWTSGTGSLKPLQIHLSERLAAHLAHALVMDAQPGVDSLLSFDLTQAKPPVRFAGDVLQHPNLRFIGLGRVQGQLEALITVLGKGLVPDELNLGGTYEAELVNEVAKRLQTGWLSAPPVRRNVRHNISVTLSITSGFAGIVDHTAGGANFNDMEGVETWGAEDISATGFRCPMDAGKAGWVKIGTLLGFRPENVDRWGVGIVRRLRRDEQNKLDIGVEILTNRAYGVVLTEGSGPTAAEHHAVWLIMSDMDETEVRLLTRPDVFSANRTVLMRAQGKQYLLLPVERKEKGDDFDFVHCRRIEQQAGNGTEGG